jgi:manganese transport protein
MVNGEMDINHLLVLSQVILSLQLGFAIIPLIHFVSDKKTMGVFTVKPIVQILAWLITSVLVYLNVRMVIEQAAGYFSNGNNFFWKMIIILGAILFLGLLIVAIVYPIITHRKVKEVPLEVHKTEEVIEDVEIPTYNRIAIALDFSLRDRQLIAHAIKQSNELTRIFLVHIVESASAKVLGEESDDFETRKDQEKLDEYVYYLKQKGFLAESSLGFRNRQKEIPRLVKEANADLLIIGAHGHSGMKDWLYGETIDAVRHQLKIPVLIVNV